MCVCDNYASLSIIYLIYDVFFFNFIVGLFASRVGIDMPTVEVRYEHLNVDAEVHVGQRSMPNFINFSINMFEVYLNLVFKTIN